MKTSFWTLCVLAMPMALFAQPRSALLDAQFDAKRVEDKDIILSEIEANLSSLGLKNLEPLRSVRARLTVQNPRVAQFEKLKAEQLVRLAELQKQIEKGRLLYFDSRFRDAAAHLKSVFQSLDSVAWVVDDVSVRTCLSYWAAASFFDGNQGEATTAMKTLLDLDPASTFSPDRFPPPVVNLFNNLKTEQRPARKRSPLKMEAIGVEARILGFRVPLIGSNPVFFEAPTAPSSLDDKTVVFERQGFAPMFFKVGQVPPEIRFESLEERRLSTLGLFGVVGARTPPRALIDLLSALQIDVCLLADFTQDLQSKWLLKAQWLDARTLQRSAIFQSENFDLKLAARILAGKLMSGRTLDGGLRAISLEELSVEKQVKAPERFYQKWWFWTAVGSALVGAGVGSYFALTAEQKRVFSIREEP